MDINYYNEQIEGCDARYAGLPQILFFPGKYPLSQPKISLRAGFLFNLNVPVFFNSLLAPNAFACFS